MNQWSFDDEQAIKYQWVISEERVIGDVTGMDD